DYLFNDGSDPGTWNVRVNSADNTLHPNSDAYSDCPPPPPPPLTPSLSSVSPTSYPADTVNHTMKLFGSNFVSGDTLTFTDPQGTTFDSVASKLTFVSTSEIDYLFNDGSDPGTWNVRVNSADNT